MTKTRAAWAICLTVAAVGLIAGCAGNADSPGPQSGSNTVTDSPTSPQPGRPTLTAPKLQPPSQDNQYTTSSGRPKVVFDPCTWISDETVQEIGFEPDSRRRGDDLIAEYSFLTCDFDSQLRDLMLNSGNATWDENLRKVGSYSDPITVNGREALLVTDPAVRRSCHIDLRTEVGFVQTVVYLTDHAPLDLDPCEGMIDIASAIEREIGKDN